MYRIVDILHELLIGRLKRFVLHKLFQDLLLMALDVGIRLCFCEAIRIIDKADEFIICPSGKLIATFILRIEECSISKQMPLRIFYGTKLLIVFEAAKQIAVGNFLDR